jgi:DNA (cytosine-5)-methyltransferase 1
MGEEKGINEGQGNRYICNAIKHSSEDGNVADSNLHGFDKRNGNDEINTSERGFNALNDIDQSNGIGNATDTESQRTREQSSENRGREDGRFNDISEDGNATDTYSSNNKTRTQREILGQSDWEKTNGHSNVERTNQWENFPTVSPICTGDDGIPDRLDSITFPKWRNESIKAGGNAVVPQVVYQIFKAIEQYENLNEWTYQ